MIDHTYVIPKKSTKKQSDDPLARPSIIFIVGGTGAGKSTLIANLLMALEKKHQWDNALFVSGNNRDDLLKSLEMDVTSSPVDLSDYMTKLKQPVTKPTYNVLVMDDCQSDPSFNIMTGRSQFAQFILSHRHYGKHNGEGGTWIILTAQTLKGSYTPVIRKNTSLWFTFIPRAIDEEKAIQDVSGDPDKMKKAMRLQRLEDKHTFLYVNKQDPTNIRYFMNLDRELDVS